MSSDRADQIAREAARLFELGQAGSVRDALRRAVDTLGTVNPPVTTGRVRQHIQAMHMQASGQAGYYADVRHIYEQVEELLAAIELAWPTARTVLVGRAARGLVDGSTEVHVRIYTDEPIETLADRLVELGYDEPTFETVNTTLGRLNRIRLPDDVGEIVLTRCLPPMYATVDRDLFTGRRTALMTPADVRDYLGTFESGDCDTADESG